MQVLEDHLADRRDPPWRASEDHVEPIGRERADLPPVREAEARPWIYPGDIVILDNLGIHKMHVVREAILDAGGIPIYLPTYSPELNPIERLWADLKRRLRTLAINAQDELLRAVRRLRASTPIEKIAAWFRHSVAEARFN